MRVNVGLLVIQLAPCLGFEPELVAKEIPSENFKAGRVRRIPS
jgi:hypothetical protein